MRRYSIERAAMLMLVVTVFEKLLGFGREMVIASQFGASGLTDAYNAGYLIPYFIMALLSAGLVNVYAPVFLSEREIDENQAWDRINSISTYLVIFILILSAIGIVCSKGIARLLYPGFSEASINSTVSISRIFFVGVLLYSITVIGGSLLNCLREFSYMELSIGILSLGIIVSVLLFGGKSNINSIAYGYIAGAAAGIVIQLVKLKSVDAKIGINFKWYKEFNSKFFILLFPILVSTSMSQVNVFVDRIFASYLAEGSMSYLSFGNKVVELPIGLFSGIISTIIFPDLIEYINRKDIDKLKVYFNKALVTILIFLIPSFTGVDVLSREIVKLLYERNAFNSFDTINTANALLSYSPTIIMYGCIAIISKVYYSMKDTRTLMNISIVTIILNAVLDYLLMKPLGHNGLALATSIVSVFQFTTSYIMLNRKVNLSLRPYLLKNILKICISSAAMAGTILCIKKLMMYYSNFVLVISSIIIGALVYFAMLKLLKVDEVDSMLQKLKFKRHVKSNN